MELTNFSFYAALCTGPYSHLFLFFFYRTRMHDGQEQLQQHQQQQSKSIMFVNKTAIYDGI